MTKGIKNIARYALASQSDKSLVSLSKRLVEVMESLNEELNHNQKEVNNHPIAFYLIGLIRRRAWTGGEDLPYVYHTVTQMAEL